MLRTWSGAVPLLHRTRRTCYWFDRRRENIALERDIAWDRWAKTLGPTTLRLGCQTIFHNCRAISRSPARFCDLRRSNRLSFANSGLAPALGRRVLDYSIRHGNRRNSKTQKTTTRNLRFGTLQFQGYQALLQCDFQFLRIPRDLVRLVETVDNSPRVTIVADLVVDIVFQASSCK